MKKLLLALPLLLAACGGQTPVERRELPPPYCIREAVVNDDGTVTVDMPGRYYGQDDKPITVSAEVYESLAVPSCTE